jgi:hypothetical protein
MMYISIAVLAVVVNKVLLLLSLCVIVKVVYCCSRITAHTSDSILQANIRVNHSRCISLNIILV